MTKRATAEYFCTDDYEPNAVLLKLSKIATRSAEFPSLRKSEFLYGIYAGLRADGVDRYEVPKMTLCERGRNSRQGKNRCDIVITVLGVGCYKIENTKLL